MKTKNLTQSTHGWVRGFRLTHGHKVVQTIALTERQTEQTKTGQNKQQRSGRQEELGKLENKIKWNWRCTIHQRDKIKQNKGIENKERKQTIT